MSCIVQSNLAQWQSIGMPVRFDPSTITPYIVDRSAGRNKNVHDMVSACLQLNRIPYCKSQIGDCGSPGAPGGPSIGSLGGTASGLTASGFAVGGAIGGSGSAAAGIAATAGLVLAPIAIGFGIFGAIEAHHAAAVNREQSVLCQVTSAYNQFADQIEAALTTGKIALQDAVVQLQRAYQQLVNLLATIEGPGTSGCNAGCFYHSALDSLLTFNKKYVYPSLVPAAQAVATPGTSSAQPAAGGTVGQPVTSGAVLLGALGYGLVGVH